MSESGITGVANNTIGALKGSPILLVMVVLNAVFIAAGSYYLSKQQDDTSQVMIKIFDRCLPDVHQNAFTIPYRKGQSPTVDIFNHDRQ
jgi:CDP-diacylglycerol pyrophosphatase